MGRSAGAGTRFGGKTGTFMNASLNLDSTIQDVWQMKMSVGCGVNISCSRSIQVINLTGEKDYTERQRSRSGAPPCMESSP